VPSLAIKQVMLKMLLLKASPSLSGVVIGKKLFSRVIKEKKGRTSTKPVLEQIDEAFDRHMPYADLEDRLFQLLNGKTSQGVRDYYGGEVIQKVLNSPETTSRNRLSGG
jgi:DNA-directed RNA polymerase subunit beta